MISQTELAGSAAYDAKSLGKLGQSAKANDPAALKAAATQFEALFINMMMKSMREATPKDGVMDSETGKMFTSMLDQQNAQNMAKRGTGLADMLMRQFSATSPAMALDPNAAASDSSLGDSLQALKAQSEAAAGKVAPAAGAAAGAAAGMGVDGVGERDPRRKSQAPHVREFQDKLTVHAEAASKETGIPAKFMLGQAALESGWGKREIRNKDGSASHNLFGIKAGAGWTGKTVQAVTTEYVNGVPTTKRETFRAYDSYADSFKDYAQLITGNKRYEKVLANAGDASAFAQGLQRAGYATDPHYATKLTRIIKHSLVG